MKSYAARTRVPVDRSRAEVEKLIHKHGCSQYLTGSDYESGRVRIQFKAQNRLIRIELEIPKGEQAARERWRALVLVMKAKLESVRAHITTFEDEFMPFIVLPNDRTVGHYMRPAIKHAYDSGAMPPGLLGPGEEP